MGSAPTVDSELDIMLGPWVKANPEAVGKAPPSSAAASAVLAAIVLRRAPMTLRPILTSVATSVRLLARFRDEGSGCGDACVRAGDELDAAVDDEMDLGEGGYPYD